MTKVGGGDGNGTTAVAHQDAAVGVGVGAPRADLGTKLELHLSASRVDPSLRAQLDRALLAPDSALTRDSSRSTAASNDKRHGSLVLLSQLAGSAVVVLVVAQPSRDLDLILAALREERSDAVVVLVVVDVSIAPYDGLAIEHGIVAWDPQGVTMAETGIVEMPAWLVIRPDRRLEAQGEGLDASVVIGALAPISPAWDGTAGRAP